MNFMRKSWPLFKALGVPVRVHASFLGILAIIALTSMSFLPIYAILIASVVVHEYGHVLAARRFDNDCGVIYLHFFGGAAIMNRASKTLKEEWMVALAGPVTSFLLFAKFTILYMIFKIDILLLAAQLNFIIGVFNLAPVYPMDGGRIFKALMEYLFGRVVGTTIAIYVARIIAVGAAIWGLLNGFYVLAVLAVIIIMMGRTEAGGR